MTDSSQARNRSTVEGYEHCARDYAAKVSQQPSDFAAGVLRRFVDTLPENSQVLEIGSGPGWDADFLETLGVTVRRTDAAAAFREFQIERGKQAEAFDLLTDEIDRAYAGIVLLYVFQHFERTHADSLLSKLARGLDDGGTLLMSHCLGEDESWEHAESGDYLVVRWSPAALDERLRQAGLEVTWETSFVGSEEPWRLLLARKRG
ncbi:MAG: class I SAM-dependent methyltransferase [Lysobacter sp.]